MTTRVHIAVRGVVQGVGFRPFIYRLATGLGLGGWVMNSPAGVFIEAEGPRESVDELILRIGRERPPHSSIQSMECTFLDPAGASSFAILPSDSSGTTGTLVLPDIAPCADCLAEMNDPANRRYRYPFTNCTHCGPRFTIIERLPYDRPNTSMKRFTMCPACAREYADPLDRRFHAQPIACPACGPRLALRDGRGTEAAGGDDALMAAAALIRDGRIVAVKGIGGFQLVVLASDDQAVLRLRSRKHREGKPFALMAPDIDAVRRLCDVSPLEERALLSPEAPIVLLGKRRDGAPEGGMSASSPVAPGNPSLGIMLPSSPMHHLLMAAVGAPVVATSGNLSDEPICFDEDEAYARLGGIADAFLVHNRPIVRHADDSIVRVVLGREMLLRRARGFAPLPLALHADSEEMLAVGAHLKNTVAVSRGANVFLSQHIGDLETEQSLAAFQRSIADLTAMFDVSPNRVVSDMHPDYLSSGFARSSGLPAVEVQHHHAHVAACMAENDVRGDVLGISWDGTGYGPDGTVWGGEFLLIDGPAFERAASFRQFRLPGGERAIREPRRQALGLLYGLLGEETFALGTLPPFRSFAPGETANLRTMLARGINAPLTSSAGRLFDAVASLTGLCQVSTFEGEAAMALEFSLAPGIDERYAFTVDDAVGSAPGAHRPRWTVDWSPMLGELLEDIEQGTGVALIAARFHNGIVEPAVEVARRAGRERIVLSGGCFQNRYLLERMVNRLREEGFRPYWHQRVPPNDGGIALGQIAVASALKKP
ncbi:MAG TPA: carbamoyltransferase HypF [Bacteroidota bacterium]|nr:carbamoyltransferase HypF [Bacteroidota bacterium]